MAKKYWYVLDEENMPTWDEANECGEKFITESLAITKAEEMAVNIPGSAYRVVMDTHIVETPVSPATVTKI